MSYRSQVLIAACCVFSFLLSVSIPAEGARAQGDLERGQNGKRVVTVADVIQMNRLADELNSLNPIAHFSPDGARCVVVLRKGNLARNVNEYSLVLWNTKDMFLNREPKRVLTMSSSSNRDAIEGVTWLSDNATIRFLGERPGELHQVYSFNILSHKLTKVTHHSTNIIAFSTSDNGRKTAYVAEEPEQSIWTDEAMREGLSVSTQVVYDLIAGRFRSRYSPNYQLFVAADATRSQPLRLAGDCGKISPVRYQPYLSPDGNYIAILTIIRVADIPREWTEYSDPLLHQWVTQQPALGDDSPLQRYTLIDTRTGRSNILLNSPIGIYSSEAAWSPDSGSIVLSDTWLPLSGIRTEERKPLLSMPFNVEVRIPTGDVTRISDDQLVLQEWNAKTTLVAFAPGRATYVPDSGDWVFFRKVHNTWSRIEHAGEEETRPEVIVEQGINTPPKIVAVDRRSGQRSLLLDPNPQFKNLEFAKEEEIDYPESGKERFKAGLYYPVDYIPGHRYPLVIQTHGYSPKEFWIDGPYTTAFAAQPLAGRDIMVLQVPEGVEDMNTPNEAEQEVLRLSIAVDYLDKRGLVDRNRVGLIGFSRSCLFVDFALTHSNYHFAAASVTDGVDGGYFQYILQANAFSTSNLTYEGINGSAPFGEGLTLWKKRAPGFNADQVHTPVLITALNLDSALFQWEWFAALRRLGKPVDLIVLKDGSHILQKPSERMISQQRNVDWFVFWLKGEDDLDPLKAGQYARWHVLRDQINDDK